MEEICPAIPEFRGVSYDRIEKNGLQTPVWDDTHPGTPYLFGESFPRGRGNFFPLEFVPIVEQPDAEYPFILSTGRVLEHWHGGTMTRHSKLDTLYPEALVQMNPVDADMLGVLDGSPVRVASRRGEIVLRAELTERISAGVVFISFHFQEAAANLLTIDALDPQALIPEYKGCAVQVFPARLDELTNPEKYLRRGRY
jgi:predicted molibdopterin-dependent oxidoreductase YjgC